MCYFVYQPVEVTRKFSADNCEDNAYNSLIKAYMWKKLIFSKVADETHVTLLDNDFFPLVVLKNV